METEIIIGVLFYYLCFAISWPNTLISNWLERKLGSFNRAITFCHVIGAIPLLIILTIKIIKL